MPLFFFHLRRSEGYEADDEGVTFDTLEEAREDAVSSLREIVADELRSGGPADLTSMEITDNHGEVVAVVTVEEAVIESLRDGGAE
ncbi:hypothetical protein ASG42_25285 [Rhizobium sp. Leaf391]|uniref:DUF6894 family protein n=1 Tax=Rhizobium sp. Leaf391 TaxID=1736360 RepID=UPI000713F702|nr:hypothetical protein [Rhizobium sp. Leaf391]KQT02813.1 hypothetical protein ASG42_25285 [Rhizobium sp. Leaf391]